MFSPTEINFDLLKARAFNLRWACVPSGVIPLTAADPDFPIAEPIKKAIVDYVSGGYLSYGPAEGLLSFRQAAATHYQTKHQVAYDPGHLLPVDSAAYGIALVCETLLQNGDEAIIFDPVDFLFRYSVEQAKAKAIAFPTPPIGGDIDFDKLENFITPKTKMICLCNPLNPTGKVFTAEELNTLGSIALKHDLWILSDEIWSDIVYSPHCFTSMASISEAVFHKTITITGYSKSYGLAGLRVGSVFMPNANLYQLIFDRSQHRSTVHGCNVVGQIAATAALKEAQPWLKDFVTHLQSMRDLVTTRLNNIPGVQCTIPQGCYVAFPNISGTGMTSEQMHQLLIEKALVATVPGLPQWFGSGAAHHIRLSFATSESVLIEALDRIEKVIVS